MPTTVYIVPALTDLAGQCRIVSRSGDFSSARDEYRRNPTSWTEIGIMNSKGRLVCIDASNPAIVEELKACEPLMAGLQFVVADAQALSA